MVGDILVNPISEGWAAESSDRDVGAEEGDRERLVVSIPKPAGSHIGGAGAEVVARNG